jgi:hypothetical protein
LKRIKENNVWSSRVENSCWDWFSKCCKEEKRINF